MLAGAGTGKTRVIVQRVARLLRQGVPAEQILAVTFTQKAALQMRARLEKTAGAAAAPVTLSTFHALGLMVLKADYRAFGLRSGFAIYDTNDQLSLVRDLMRQVKVADRRLDARRLCDLIMKTKQAGRSEVELRWGDDYELAAYDLYPRYMAQMRAFNAIDFDDLLVGCSQVLKTPEVGARWRARWSWVMVDEYQDTSPPQLEMVRLLAAPQHNICAVGDDDQAIYGWRGAAADTILNFSRTFPGTREVTLEENYRSTGHILAAANTVVAANLTRRPKTLWSRLGAGAELEIVGCIDGEDEAVFVAELVADVLAEGGRPPAGIAVLMRARAGSDQYEEALVQANVPHRVVGGQAFYDRKEVRDVLAIMTLAAYPADEGALRRIINTPPRGLGPKSVEQLSQWGEARALGLGAALQAAGGRPGGPADSPLDGHAQRGAEAFVQAFGAAAGGAAARLRSAREGAAEDALRALVAGLGLRQAIVDGGDAAKLTERRLDSLEAMMSSWGRFARRWRGRGAPCAAFVRAHQRSREAAEQEDLPGMVTLMTLHAAKGLEFDMVVMVGVEEDLLPHRKTVDEGGSLEEERRLCYVGMTRARRRLVMTYARQRSRAGRPQPRTPSRFMDGLAAGAGVARRERSEDDADRVARADAAAQAFFAEVSQKLGLDMQAMPVRAAGRRSTPSEVPQ